MKKQEIYNYNKHRDSLVSAKRWQLKTVSYNCEKCLKASGCPFLILHYYFLLLPRKHYKIRCRNLLHPRLPEQGHELTTVITAVIKQVQHHLPYRLFEMISLQVLISKHMLQLPVTGIGHPLFPAFGLIQQQSRQFLKGTFEMIGRGKNMFCQLQPLPPVVLGRKQMQYSMVQGGKAADHFLLKHRFIQPVHQFQESLVGPPVVGGILLQVFFHVCKTM